MSDIVIVWFWGLFLGYFLYKLITIEKERIKMTQDAFSKHQHVTPFWQWWEKCPKCRGRVWIKSQTVVAEGVRKIYTCMGCGYPKSRSE